MMDIRAFEAELEKLRSGFSFDTTKPCGMYVAALARAEAAITESNSAARRAFSAEVENQRLTKEAAGLRARAEAIEAERDDLRDAQNVLSEALEAARKTLVELTARVAELEAQRRFRRGYPDKPGMYIIRRADGTVGAARYYTDGYHWGAFSADITQWAEMPEEPTP